jgi:hypothetical protein
LLTLFPPGIDIKDIPNVNDHDFSITLNGFFIVRWTDRRLLIQDVKFGPEGDQLVPVEISMVMFLLIKKKISFYKTETFSEHFPEKEKFVRLS